MLRISPKAPFALLAVGFLSGTAAAQVPVTIVPGFAFQSWNAGTSTEGRIDWPPESLGTGWFNGLRWNWQTVDGMGDPVSPAVRPVFDPAVPGISGAYKFPEAKAASIDVGATTPRAAWESNAQPGEPGTFELWFKPSDLTGTHALWEIGASGKGVAFTLDGSDLVYTVQANDGAGGNVVSYEYRQPLTDTDWHQAVITIDLISFRITSYFDGQEVNNQSFTPSATYRWAGGNPAGLGMVGSDPAFPDSGVAGDPVDPASFTDYDGWISTLRFYDVDLFANEVLDNYNAITDAAAVDRRADFNGDGSANSTDAFDYVTFMTSTDTTPVAPFSFPFPHEVGGGVQTNDPYLDETFVGDFYWQRDGGFNPTSQEPSFQFPAVNVLEPMPINDPAFPSIRTAFVLDGVEAFRGPKFEFAEDSSSVRVLFWLFVDDLVGNHCLFEAGGSSVGFSMVTRGDEIGGRINTSANDGLDEVEITSGPGVLQTGWRRFEVVVRRFTGGGVGQGFELYMDGQQIAAINDLPGDDGEFGTADDIDLFSPAGTGNSNFIGGNQAGLGQVQGTAPLPFGFDGTELTPFNGMAGPFRLTQSQPLPADIAADFAADATQNVLNGRGDTNRDGSADFFDVLDNLKMFDAAQ